MTQEIIDTNVATAREHERERRARADALVTGLIETDKVRENRLRRAANRQGLKLIKSRRRDPRALDFGAYWLVTASGNVIVTSEQGTDLDGAEGYLFPDQFRAPE